METPNYVAAFLDAQEAGRQNARRRVVQNALGKINSDPGAAQDELMRAGAFEEAAQAAHLGQVRRDQQLRTKIAPKVSSGDYAGAEQDAAAGGDFELAKTLGGMDDHKLKLMEGNTQKVAAIAHYLQTVTDPNERQAIWQQTAPHLVQQGILRQEDVPNIDISDHGLQAYQAQGMTVSQQIELEFKKRAEQMKGDQFDETKRHNRADEHISQQNADAHTFSAHKPPAGGGAGVPAAPTGAWESF